MTTGPLIEKKSIEVSKRRAGRGRYGRISKGRALRGGRVGGVEGRSVGRAAGHLVHLGELEHVVDWLQKLEPVVCRLLARAPLTRVPHQSAISLIHVLIIIHLECRLTTTKRSENQPTENSIF
jgi:hypothetical protein